MINFLKKLFRRRSNCYAVIYDVYDPDKDEWDEEFYESFSSPEEATLFFNEAYGSMAQDVYNPRIVIISDPIPGDWNAEHEYRGLSSGVKA
jgi:hypothetical protein